jgi:hypothetical protein
MADLGLDGQLIITNAHVCFELLVNSEQCFTSFFFFFLVIHSSVRVCFFFFCFSNFFFISFFFFLFVIYMRKKKKTEVSVCVFVHICLVRGQACFHNKFNRSVNHILRSFFLGP